MNSRPAFLFISLAATALVAACSLVPGDGALIAGLEATPAPIDGYLRGLREGDAQRQELCARGNQDGFSTWYCQPQPPVIKGLDDVLIGLKLKDPANPFAMQFAMTSHSTSLIGRNVSSLNPRVVIFTPAPFLEGPVSTTGGATTGTSGFIAVGFARGSHLMEIAAFDPAKFDINFYLLHYTKPCDPDCPNSELFSPETERNWQSVTVYGDPDINNTPLDCLQCHQPGGLGTPRMLRMQERQFPWTHWFIPQFGGEGPPVNAGPNAGAAVATTPAPGGGANPVIAEFVAAHPNESYGGITPDMVGASSPPSLEALVELNGFSDQPNEFNGNMIEQEGRGPTWLGIYANAINGHAISVPSYKADPFDPLLIDIATKRYLVGNIPNMSAVFPEADMGDLGFRASDSAKTGEQVVAHRCGTCHSGLFPGISRNNFDVHQFPATLSAAERDVVLYRIRLPAGDPKRMPPAQFSDLTEAQIRMIEKSLGAPAP